ncbi:putative 2-aminoethylphosphonate ABC transporter ATP-binding protein [Roseovarius sp. SYSU LYC5161]|uniref:putative 2-aminoethylphosphonate ABC transporter ATP-binding protein n=1 Tax=Roseovarius halophilus (ex Wu et al. 2025) TaxID=3376060 RepID=UPI00399A6494
MQDSYLQISGVWKFFGDFVALRDVSLEIREGELVCFLGPSGCGKTTLLRAIAGLDLQTNGEIRQAGKDISDLPPSGRDFGIVFQSYALFPNLTAHRNIAFGLENEGRTRGEIDSRVQELLSVVGLPAQGPKYPSQLSGGQQQRIALARALATEPGLLLLDEPLSALDARVRVHLRHQIKELQRQLGVTTVMVTHDQEEALAMADRIVVMNHGVIEQIGTPTEVYRMPASLFVADFIGEMNQIPVRTVTPDVVMLGNTKMHCVPHEFVPDHEVIAAIRPNDIIPLQGDGLPDVDNPHASSAGNRFAVTVDEMEFLGSFWRCVLGSPHFREKTLIADFSVNAARRLDLAVGSRMQVELPQDRLMVFPATVE